MENYKKILTSSKDEIKKNYYSLFIINNFCLIDDFPSFVESLFDKKILTDEKEQLLFVLSYLTESNHLIFSTTNSYLKLLKNYYICLLKDNEYKDYCKDILNQLNIVEKNIKQEKELSLQENYLSSYGLNNKKVSIPFTKKIVSSDLLMYDYLFVGHLNDIVDENFKTEKVLYAASLYHIFNTIPLNNENMIEKIKEKMVSFLYKYLENEHDEEKIIFIKKVMDLFQYYLKINKTNNVFYLPERPRLVYQSEPLNGKVLQFKKKD